MEIFDECLCFVGLVQEHLREAHPGVLIPNYILQQSKLEILSLASTSDAQLEAMSSLSDVSDMTSSLVDFDEEEDGVDDEEVGADEDEDAMTSPKRQRKSPPFQAAAAATVSGGSDVMAHHVTRMNPERDNYNVDRITFCWKCGVEFESRKLLLRHLRDHNIDLPYKCYLCDASYASRVDCLRHAETFHASDWSLLRDKNKVDDVERYARAAEVQVQETLTNLGLSEQPSDDVSFVDRSTSGLNVDSDYAQRKVFCSFCVKRFWSLQDLRRHMRSHTGVYDVSMTSRWRCRGK